MNIDNLKLTPNATDKEIVAVLGSIRKLSDEIELIETLLKSQPENRDQLNQLAKQKQEMSNDCLLQISNILTKMVGNLDVLTNHVQNEIRRQFDSTFK